MISLNSQVIKAILSRLSKLVSYLKGGIMENFRIEVLTCHLVLAIRRISPISIAVFSTL